MPIRDAIQDWVNRAIEWTGLRPTEPASAPIEPRDIASNQSLVRRALNFIGLRPRPGSVSDPNYDPGDAAALRLGEATRRRTDGTASLAMLISHQEQFAAKWGAGLNVYWSRFDEALRDNWLNALAMRRSTFIEELMNARKTPISGLEWHIEVEDSKDPDQKATAERVHKGIEAIPKFASMRYYLGEDKWQGKYGSQVSWGEKRIGSKPLITVTSHEPVDGDSIVYKYDKTPGILIRTGWLPPAGKDQRYIEGPQKEWIQPTDRARALFLYDQFWRDHFIISNFNPRSADYLYEGDKAAAIFGLGYRGMFYWDFQLREELRSWLIEALQRIGVNGMLYGFFESGNEAMMNDVILSLKMLIRDNVTAFPYLKGETIPKEIQHIEPSKVGYEILAHWIEILEETMRRGMLGQSLSSQAQATGMGSEVAKLHEQTLQLILRNDAADQQETLTEQLIGPMVRFNDWEVRGQTYHGELPFNVRFVYSIDKADATERANITQVAFGMGLPLSREQTYADLGLAPPKGPDDVLKQPEQAPGASGAGAGAGGPNGDGAALGPAGSPMHAMAMKAVHRTGPGSPVAVNRLKGGKIGVNGAKATLPRVSDQEMAAHAASVRGTNGAVK